MATVPKETIVVVGFGWVGQANALALTRMGYDVRFYDVVTPPRHYAKEYGELYECIRPIATPLQVDSSSTWYIVCIGDRVREDGFQDISLIVKALKMLEPAVGKVMLRSTILPNYLKDLRFHLYVPEFLHEILAVEECLAPHFFVVGEREHLAWPSFLNEWKERGRKTFVGTPEEASHIKYLSNIWNAVRIAFTNEFGNTLAEPVDEAAQAQIERVINFVLEKKSYLRYGQPFGGHCLPKDLSAYIGAKKNTCVVPLLQGTWDSNEHNRTIAGKYASLPQWFSVWDDEGQGVARKALENLWWRFNSLSIIALLRRKFRPLRRIFERLLPQQSLESHKRAWESYALENPFYYTYPDTPSHQKVDEFELRETGKSDFARYVIDDTELQSVLGSNIKTVLEIGTGVGRVTDFFAEKFKRVYGIDISPTMLAVARKRLAGRDNITLAETTGNRIPFNDNQFDFIFSCQVFKHVPSVDVIAEYLREIKRTLKVGGIAKVQMRTGSEVYRWRWFYGPTLSPAEAQKLAEIAGITVIRSEVENPKSLWLWLKKV